MANLQKQKTEEKSKIASFLIKATKSRHFGQKLRLSIKLCHIVF